MPLPLPRVVADVGPGGPLVTALGGINALQRQMLENQYYGPSQQASIDSTNALTQGRNIENQYLPDKLRLANAFSKLQNQYYAPNIQSEINQRNALTNKYNVMTPLEAQELSLKNQFYPELTKQQIESSKALAGIRGMGGLGMGAGDKAELFFQNLIQRDNPNLSPEQVYEASNVVREGGNQLSDGTKINPLSPASKDSLNRLKKYGTTSSLISGNIKGEQAENEIDTLTKYSDAGLKPYGTTYLGYSPAQILDTFKSDKASQERLGRFIAGKQFQYDIAQNAIRLANATSGVKITEELMKLGMQNISAAYPRLSATAREAAQKYFVEGLKKGYESRKHVDIGAANATSKQSKPNQEIKPTLRYNPATGDLEEIK